MGVILGGLEDFYHADAPEGGAGNLTASFFGGVIKSEFQGIDTELLAEFIDGLFRSERSGG